MSQYEGFLGAVVKDFDSRLQVIQKAAEENMKGSKRSLSVKLGMYDLSYNSIAYEAYCGELKRQLESVSAERDQLQKKVESQRSSGGGGVLDLLVQMTALSVSVTSSNTSEIIYTCQLLEGVMAGKHM